MADPSTIDFDPNRLVNIDFGATPTAARLQRIKIHDIEIDDHFTDGGLTTVGPRWPGGNPIGAAWLASRICDRLKPTPTRVRAGGHEYEYTSYQYFEGEQHDRRFYGFHARIIDTQGSVTRVELWNRGTSISDPQHPASAWWFDLNAVADPNHTVINPIGKVLEGALFLDAHTVGLIQVSDPKIPPYKGELRLLGPKS
jgi:hypothetical protein